MGRKKKKRYIKVTKTSPVLTTLLKIWTWWSLTSCVIDVCHLRGVDDLPFLHIHGSRLESSCTEGVSQCQPPSGDWSICGETVHQTTHRDRGSYVPNSGELPGGVIRSRHSESVTCHVRVLGTDLLTSPRWTHSD